MIVPENPKIIAHDPIVEPEAPATLDLATIQRFLENPEVVRLDQATSLDEDAAKLLAAKAISARQRYLELNGLTSLTEGTALALKFYDGTLSFNGLKSIPDPVAAALCPATIKNSLGDN